MSSLFPNTPSITKMLKLGVSIPTAMIFSELFGGPGGVAGFLLFSVTLLIFLAAAHLSIDRYIAWLFRQTSKTNEFHRISVGNVEVGTISESEYAKIQLEVLKSGVVLARQTLNMLEAAYKFSLTLVVAIPTVAFWGVVALALWQPQTITDLMAQMSGPRLAVVVNGLALVTVWVLIVSMFFGNRYGFRNCYAEAVNIELCRHFGVPEHEEVRVLKEQAAEVSTST